MRGRRRDRGDVITSSMTRKRSGHTGPEPGGIPCTCRERPPRVSHRPPRGQAGTPGGADQDRKPLLAREATGPRGHAEGHAPDEPVPRRHHPHTLTTDAGHSRGSRASWRLTGSRHRNEDNDDCDRGGQAHAPSTGRAASGRSPVRRGQITRPPCLGPPDKRGGHTKHPSASSPL